MAERLTVARPYAGAVFEVALADKKLREWSDALQLLAAFVKDATMQALLLNPGITATQMTAFLHQLCEQRLSAVTRALKVQLHNCIRLLAHEKRLGYLPEIATLYEQRLAEHNDEVAVIVTSATPLSAAQRERLRQRLEARLKTKVTSVYEEDQAILGGLLVRAKDWVIDASLRSQLLQLKTSLMHT